MDTVDEIKRQLKCAAGLINDVTNYEEEIGKISGQEAEKRRESTNKLLAEIEEAIDVAVLEDLMKRMGTQQEDSN